MAAAPHVEPFPMTRLLPYSAFTGVLGFLPIPVVDDWSASLARAAMLRRISRHHGKVLQPDALRALSRHAAPTPTLPARALFKMASFVFRRTFIFVGVAGAADEAMHTFVLGHLFDRYLSQRHPASDDTITAEHAKSLQTALDAGVRSAARGVLRDMFLQSVLAGAEALSELPESLRRALHEMEGRRDDDLDDGEGLSATFLGRVQQALTDCQTCYLKDIDAAFDRALPRARRTASPSSRKRRETVHQGNGTTMHAPMGVRHKASTTTQ